MKAKPAYSEKHERRITMEVVVDCYGPEELAMGWYYCLEDRLQFPFTAACIKKRAISPLRVSNKVEVTGMAPEDECGSEIFVTIGRGRYTLAVPLAQLRPVGDTDQATRDAVEDWHYWLGRGYSFG